jgi:polysaccharide biosynthesis/export protein
VSDRSRYPWKLLYAGLLLSLVLASGCARSKAPLGPDLAGEPVPPLLIAQGDVVDVRFFYTPELDESQVVRRDGFISLRLVGDVPAAGRTPQELRQDLEQLFAEHLHAPQVTLMIRQSRENRVWVTGEVKRPGPVSMGGPLTVLEAIMDVGGALEPWADLRKVVVIRQRDGRHYSCVVNLRDAMRGKEAVQFLLQPRDVVHVPRFVYGVPFEKDQ